MVYIFIQLWRYIYIDSGSEQVIKGYTFEMMIWYLIITETIACLFPSRLITRALSDDIRSGRIAYQLVRPYNYFSYQVTNFFSVAMFRVVFILATGMLVGFIFIGTLPTFTPESFSLGLVSLAIGIFLWCTIFVIVGMLAFWVENSQPFGWIIHKFFLMLVLFFPPEIFGKTVQQIITYSPLHAVMSGPASLFVNFSVELFWQTLTIQMIYLVTLLGLGFFVLRKGAKKVNVYGG